MPRWLFVTLTLLCLAAKPAFADNGLITRVSAHPADETIQRFEFSVNASAAQGWMVFTRLDHADAAQKNGLSLRTRTVIVFGNPRLGTPGMQKAPTVAIDVPLKALVWEDDQGKVWLTYNTADYLQNVIYPRHGLPSNPDAAKNLGALLAHFADAATQ